MNRLSTTLAIALTASCATLAAGCGSSSPQTSSASVSPISGMSPRAQYAAFAQVVNLRSADLPGFEEEAKRRERFHVENRALEGGAVYRRCFSRVNKSKPVFKARSHTFKSGRGLTSVNVSSIVEVMRSARAADQEMTAVQSLLESASARNCLSRLFDQLGSAAQTKRVGRGALRITVGKLAIAPVHLSKLPSGSTAAAGFTMTMNVAYHVSVAERHLTIPETLRLDILGLAFGRAEVSLATTVLGAPFPVGTEARLVGLLASRASTARRLYAGVNG